MTLMVFLLALGSVARITRFIVEDFLFEGPRSWISRRFGDAHPLATLVSCTWCSSIWASALVFSTAWLAQGADWWVYPAAALTASYAYSAAAAWIEDEH